MENPDLHDHSLFVSQLSESKTYRCISIGKYQDHLVGVLKSKFGAPAVAMTIDVLASLGVTNIIGVGFCGGLQEYIQCGDIVLPLACIRDDGTSVRYVAEAYPAVADIYSLDILRNLAAATHHPWHCGLVWSTDAVLLETSDLVEYWSSRGVSGVDMESGALFTISRLLGMRTAVILVASDNPASGQEMEPDKLSAGIAAAVSLSFEFAKKT
ncbi:MAG: hypothetical protein AB3A66_16215 [Nodularia sp. CChRGM 3473]